MLIGEQPGDSEDREGKPFVGPAGQFLFSLLAEAGIKRAQVYVTNAVKHFKWEPRGKRRIHQKPNQVEIAACRPWLESEIRVVKPELIVCLGVTAASALFERSITIRSLRGKFLPGPLGTIATVTTHPSSILRSPTPKARKEAENMLRDDILKAARWLREHAPPRSHR